MAISKHATTVAHIGNKVVVTYHQTVIVELEKTAEGKTLVTLNFGHPDYMTPTTIKKMNQVSQEYNLGYTVFKKQKAVFIGFQNKGIARFPGIKTQFEV